MEQPAPLPIVRVLVAEDHPLNQQVLRAMLVKLGCAVDVVSNGIEAVKAVAAGQTYDIILMDVHMPVLDGLEATRRIRALPGPAPFIVALTADASPEGRQICVDAGMTGYLGKPVTIDALRTVIGRELAGAVESVDPASTEGDEPPVLDRALVERLYSLSGERGRAEVDDLLRKFLSELPARVASLRHALAAGDLAGLSASAHALHGTAATFGAKRVAALCEEMVEVSRRRGALSAVEELLSRLELEIGPLDAALRPGDDGLSAG